MRSEERRGGKEGRWSWVPARATDNAQEEVRAERPERERRSANEWCGG